MKCEADHRFVFVCAFLALPDVVLSSRRIQHLGFIINLYQYGTCACEITVFVLLLHDDVSERIS
jgi:hypothetical protein